MMTLSQPPASARQVLDSLYLTTYPLVQITNEYE